MVNPLLEKIKKNSTVKESAVLENSTFFNDNCVIPTSVPAINIALSGTLNGGLTSGLTVFAGISKNFKTGFSLFLSKTYMDYYDDAVLIYLDNEFGTPKSYFDSFNIDKTRVLHVPITDIEQLKFECIKQLNDLKRGDHVIFVIDSIGNMASRKEIEDTENEKSVADFTRAKSLKSFFRMVTPHLTLKDIPMIAISHTYSEMGLYPKEIVSSGRGIYFGANQIFIVGRRQEKEANEVSGYEFILNVEKSRFVKEKSKIPISVSFNNGISKYSGLLDMALDAGFIIKPSKGCYFKVNKETGEIGTEKYNLKDINTPTFWNPILQNKEFHTWIETNYRIGYGSILRDDQLNSIIEDVIESTK